MPRPREFDTDAALDTALETFWRLGYGATRVADLTEAMGLSRRSLYNAFGDKQALFLAVLGRYAGVYRALFAALDAEPDVQKAVAALFRDVARGLSSPTGPTGCLIAGTTAACRSDEPALVAALAQEQRAMDAAVKRRLEHAREDGQLAVGTDTSTLAAFVTGTVSAMAVRARVDPDETTLAAMADWAMRAWPGR